MDRERKSRVLTSGCMRSDLLLRACMSFIMSCDLNGRTALLVGEASGGFSVMCGRVKTWNGSMLRWAEGISSPVLNCLRNEEARYA